MIKTNSAYKSDAAGGDRSLAAATLSSRAESNVDDDERSRIHQRLTRPKSKFMNSSGLPCLFPPPESLLELANQ